MKKLFLFLTMVFLLTTTNSNAQKITYHHCYKVSQGVQSWGDFDTTVEITSKEVRINMNGKEVVLSIVGTTKGVTNDNAKYEMFTVKYPSGITAYIQRFENSQYGVRFILDNGDTYQLTQN